MSSAAERSDFTPQAERFSPHALALAVFAHLLLGAALTWGISWKQSDPQVSFSAELWSPTVQEAAPAAVEPPPPPPPPPPAPVPAPTPPPPAVAVPTPAVPDADIALEKEKKRKQKEADEKRALAEKAKEIEREKEKARQAEKVEKVEKMEKAERVEQQAKADKARKAKEAEAEAQKLQAKKEQDAKKQAAQEAAADAKRRKDAMDRMMGMAGATGGADAKGSALQSSGPSANYGGKVRAKVKPNVVFTDDISGNPTAEVEVRTTPDGTIISQKLIKPSGNKAWDEAVIKAIIRTESLPRDVDGRVPTPLIISFRPKD